MIFFDVDNTLLDDRTAQAAAAMAIYRQNPNLQEFYTKAEFPGIWDEETQKYYQHYKAGKLTFEQQRLETLKSVFKKNLAEQESTEILTDYQTAYEENWQLYPDVIPMLEKYKDVAKGIISNGDKDEQRQKLRKTGIEDHFDIIVISDDIKIFKPDPAVFLHAVNQAGKEPSQCYYCGDKVDTDAKAAMDAGLVGIWLNRRIVDPKTEKVPEIISLNDLVYTSK